MKGKTTKSNKVGEISKEKQKQEVDKNTNEPILEGGSEENEHEFTR